MGFSGRCRKRLPGIATGSRHARGARLRWRPLAMTHATGSGADMVRTRAQLLAEDAFRRQQPLVLRRGVERPARTTTDRALLVRVAG